MDARKPKGKRGRDWCAIPVWSDKDDRPFEVALCEACGFRELRKALHGDHCGPGGMVTLYGQCPLCLTELREATVMEPFDPWQTSSWMYDGEHSSYREVTYEYQSRDPVVCPQCEGPLDPVVNRWYCRGAFLAVATCTMRDPLYADQVGRIRTWQDPMHESGQTFAVSTPDPWYEQTTALWRTPAASNWTRARNDPRLPSRRMEGLRRGVDRRAARASGLGAALHAHRLRIL